MPVRKRDAPAGDRGAREFDRAGKADHPEPSLALVEPQAVAVCGRRPSGPLRSCERPLAGVERRGTPARRPYVAGRGARRNHPSRAAVMTALTTVGPKLSKLIPLLASDKDGEVVATARAIGRTLAQAGADFHDLAAAIARTEPPVEPVCWRHIPPSERVMWLIETRASRFLSPWEQNFCTSILVQLRYRPRSTLSAKQIAVLDGCILKFIAKVRHDIPRHVLSDPHDKTLAEDQRPGRSTRRSDHCGARRGDRKSVV